MVNVKLKVNYKTGFERHVPKYLRPLFDEFSDETFSGDGYWGYLVPGYRCLDTGCHQVHEWTLAEFLRSCRHEIVKCDCDECMKKLGQ